MIKPLLSGPPLPADSLAPKLAGSEESYNGTYGDPELISNFFRCEHARAFVLTLQRDLAQMS